MFIGREKEIQQIKSILDRDEKNAILIYGKRRIGKSFLITEIMKSYKCRVINYECLNTSLEENLSHFENRIKVVFNNRYLHFDSFEDAFQFLGTSGEKVIVVLDEYSYLKSSREKKYIDSMFQRIIDRMEGDLHLVILGSFVSIMQELLEEENPLFGRFSLVMHLSAFDYYDSSLFYPEKTIREKIEFYSIFGGNPFVNHEIDPGKNLQENIKSLLLNQNSAVRSYLEHILLSELSKVSPANMILSSLSNGRKKYTEISELIRSETPGSLDKQLKNLIRMDIITKYNPINKLNDRKKSFYTISDNLVRFYYAYIFSNRDVIRTIGENAFYDLLIQPTINTFISYRFEELAREYFRRMSINKQMKNIYNIGSYWYDDPSEHKNGEFDCVLMHQSTYSFYEVKFHREPISLALCEQEEKEVRRLAGSIEIEKIGFISASGFNFSTDKYDLISGEQLYRQK